MKWLFLASAILLEVAAALSMQAAVGHAGWYALVVIGYVGAFLLLVQVLKAGMAVGVAYGIWGATGVALTAVLAAILFGQELTGVMIMGLVLIVGGVLLVEIGSQRALASTRKQAVPAAERVDA
jgi:small multidrug resistance pump